MNPTHPILPHEHDFWKKEDSSQKIKFTDEEISQKYDSKSERIVTETNREKLQNFYESLSRPNYMDPRPSYQRRQRWSEERQSQLIESFLINIPIPPLFVYETKPNVHEVMDGQQRISAIRAFYSNQLTLTGLSRWPELNGRTYDKLPERIRSGIDRRSISWITVLTESSDSESDALGIKQLVFERLNTGGVKLSHQEIRNALYSGPFNNLLIQLSESDAHRAAWSLPPYTASERKYVPESLTDSTFYLEMQDVEVILRFFALRHVHHYTKGMKGFLDIYMEKARSLTSNDLKALGDLYTETIQLANRIYQGLIFRPYIKKRGAWEWGSVPQKAYADAVLVALSGFLSRGDHLVREKEKIFTETAKYFKEDERGVLTGRGNTKADVQERIKWLTKIYTSVL